VSPIFPTLLLTSPANNHPIKSDKAIAFPFSHRSDDGFIISITRPTIRNAKAIVAATQRFRRSCCGAFHAVNLPERIVVQLSANDEHDGHAETNEKCGNRDRRLNMLGMKNGTASK